MTSKLFLKDHLGAANVIFSGDRGMKNGDNFQLLDDIAYKLGAAIGSCRCWFCT